MYMSHLISAQKNTFEFLGTRISIVVKGGNIVTDSEVAIPPKYGSFNNRLKKLYEISIKSYVYLSINLITICYMLL